MSTLRKTVTRQRRKRKYKMSWCLDRVEVVDGAFVVQAVVLKFWDNDWNPTIQGFTKYYVGPEVADAAKLWEQFIRGDLDPLIMEGTL